MVLRRALLSFHSKERKKTMNPRRLPRFLRPLPAMAPRRRPR